MISSPKKGAYSRVLTIVSLSLLRCTPTPLRRLRTLLLRPKRRLPTITNTTVLSRLHPSTTVPGGRLMRFLDIIRLRIESMDRMIRRGRGVYFFAVRVGRVLHV